VGLSLAFACSILLFLTSYQEFTYNGMHEHKDNIYRYYLKVNEPTEVKYGSSVPSPVKEALINDYSDQIRYVTRIRDISFVTKYKDKSIEEQAVAVDPEYVNIFSFEWLKGSPESSLNELNNVVLREDIAKNIFGNEDPMGKIIQAELGDTPIPLKVSGITAKLPANTSIENEMMVRYELLPDYHENKDRWNHSSSILYVQVKDGVIHTDFEKSLKSFCPKYYKDAIAQLEKEGAKRDENGEIVSVKMLPFGKEHFDKNVGGGRSVSIIYPYTLLIISIFILFIACINFVNLSISRSILRTKEVGIRKSLGALKSQIVSQFWGESLVVCVVSFLIGLLLYWSLVSSYNAIFNTKLDFSLLLDKNILAIIILSFLIITLLAGGYPAWFISKFNTVEILKGKLKTGNGSDTIRKALIIKQFTISILLISCTVIIWNQLYYLRTKPLGFNQDHVISIPAGREIDGARLMTLMRAELAGNPGIKSIAAADNNVGFGKDNFASKSQFGFIHQGKSASTNGLFVDFEYIKTLGLSLKEGRDFSTQYATDSTQACIINETMAASLGGGDLLGKKLDLNGGLTIVGIINDYHFESLKNNIEPITLMVKGFPYTHIFIKIASDNVDATLAAIEKTYKKLAPNSEYLGSFLEENRNEQYRAERRFTQMFFYAAGLAILLSCLGLFAISVITINQRIKEIGIRKVLGSSISALVWDLSKDYLKFVVIAICIASPIAWYFMKQWLSDYAYRIDIEWWVFVLTGILALIIAFCTISYHSVSAALMNPVKSLRSE
jgi:ABC-type antimicrobial peptide transport system permease subunit